MPRFALALGARVYRPGELPRERIPGKRRKPNPVYGEVIAVLDVDTYTVRWDDRSLVDSDHKYSSRGKSGCICRVPDNDGRENDPTVPIPAVDQDDSSSESDSSSEDEEDEEDEPDDDLDRQREILGSPQRRSPRRRQAIGAAPATPPSRREQYDMGMAELEKLHGQKVTVGGVEWTVVADDGSLEREPDVVVPSTTKFFPTLSPRDENFEAILFEKMLFTDVADMVALINNAAREAEDDKWVDITEHQFGKFLGLILGGAWMPETGEFNWTKPPKTFCEGITPYKHYMSLNDFKRIRRYAHASMVDTTARVNQCSDWYKLAGAQKKFNERRRKMFNDVAELSHIVLDESMSAWKPRTSKAGGLPNITYIVRKPKPFGTEFKTAIDPCSGVMLCLEVQQGAAEMKKVRHEILQKDVNPTTACTEVLIRACPPPQHRHLKRTVIFDAWFGSVNTALMVAKMRASSEGYEGVDGEHVICVIKNGKARYPAAFLKEHLKGKSPGCKLVLTATVEGVDLVAFGWVFNKHKKAQKGMHMFLMSKGAASTKYDPINQHTVTAYNQFRRAIREGVQQPQAAGEYHTWANAIDVHNQLRQGVLKLEEHWKTTNCWFRPFTTFISIAVVDAFNVSKQYVKKDVTLLDFASKLAKQLVNNTWPGFDAGNSRNSNRTRGSCNAVEVRVSDTAMAPRFHPGLDPGLPRPCEVIPRTKAVERGLLPPDAGRQTSCAMCKRRTGWICIGAFCGFRGCCMALGARPDQADCAIRHLRALRDRRSAAGLFLPTPIPMQSLDTPNA